MFGKRSLTRRIILSYLLIISLSLGSVGIFFSITAGKYLERQTQNNLKKMADNIKKSIREDINTLKKDPGGEGYLAENKLLQTIRDTARRSVLVQDSSYAILTKDKKIIFPVIKNTEEYDRFKYNILPLLWNESGKLKESNNKIEIENIDYLCITMPIPLKTEVNPGLGGWIIIYSPIGQVKELSKGILLVMLGDLVFTALLTIIVGVIIAKSIGKPIQQLKNRAELLSKRDFDTKIDINSGDEIEDLAKTFNKVASELKEYDIGQKKFLQNASHELKTPLMSIQGYAEGIKDGVFDDNEHALDVIIEESNRLKKIVEELIYLSKLETMGDFYKYQPESINKIIENSVEKIASIALKSNIKINTLLSKDATLNIDADKLIQAFINIIGNGMRYAKNEINIISSNDGKTYQISIIDDGEGFNERDIQHLFERFYKGKNGNHGLGLPITKVIIEKHQGTIGAFNSNDSGAEFLIKLPIK